MNAFKIALCFLTLISNLVVAEECVILLHGLARSGASMEKMERKLSEKGYLIVNQGYPSRKYSVEMLAADIVPTAVKKCGGEVPINFVTHSLGGILLRQYLHMNEIPQLKRVVMLGPPNRGSQVVDTFKNVPGFSWINGPAGQQLGTDDKSIIKALGPADFEVGIIAGSRTINLILSLALPNPNDGKVSVENTKLEGMKDHMTVPVSHPFLMKDDEVIKQVLRFLTTGDFDHAEVNGA